MKKTVFISCLALMTFSLAGFAYLNRVSFVPSQQKKSYKKTGDYDFKNFLDKYTVPELVYKVNTRFIHKITKDDLFNAKSIVDILPQKATQAIVSYHSVRVSVLDKNNDNIMSKTGDNEHLNTDQINLLHSIDYSTNFNITANYSSIDALSSEVKNSYLVYYISVVPEQEAQFTEGHDALIQYLKENSKKETSIIDRENLKAARIQFTVTKKGEIKHIKLTSTSGYPSVDETLVELVNGTSNKWTPAMNANGESVDQELMFFFGIEGC